MLRYGSLPVELEPQQTQTVSVTPAPIALHAGLIAGFIGPRHRHHLHDRHYRLLGVVAIISLQAMMLWTIIAYLGETRGLASRSPASPASSCRSACPWTRTSSTT